LEAKRAKVRRKVRRRRTFRRTVRRTVRRPPKSHSAVRFGGPPEISVLGPDFPA
jgi:hypothetical protein